MGPPLQKKALHYQSIQILTTDVYQPRGCRLIKDIFNMDQIWKPFIDKSKAYDKLCFTIELYGFNNLGISYDCTSDDSWTAKHLEKEYSESIVFVLNDCNRRDGLDWRSNPEALFNQYIRPHQFTWTKVMCFLQTGLDKMTKVQWTATA